MTELTPSHNLDPAGLVFDRPLVARRRAAATLAKADFLHRRVAEDLSDRLLATNREFKTALELGARGGYFAKTEAARGIEHLTGADLVPPLTPASHDAFQIIDEERLPFSPASFDLIIAPLTLHVVNDLPGALAQIRRCLKPDGLFLGTLFGGETLRELRASLLVAEDEIMGGVSPRIVPVVDIRDAGALLQRAGFALPVADTDLVTVRYASMFDLMADLKAMGESNCLLARHKRLTPRSLFLRAAEIYAERYGDADGKVPSSFEILHVAGWAPDASQQKPLRPGSAKARLADVLDTDEQKLPRE